MTDKREDIFKPKLWRIRSRGGARAKSYVNRVLHQISAVGNSGFGTGGASRKFTGIRIGRGNTMLHHGRVKPRFGSSYRRVGHRRVIIKTRIVKLMAGGPKGVLGRPALICVTSSAMALPGRTNRVSSMMRRMAKKTAKPSLNAVKATAVSFCSIGSFAALSATSRIISSWVAQTWVALQVDSGRIRTSRWDYN